MYAYKEFIMGIISFLEDIGKKLVTNANAATNTVSSTLNTAKDVVASVTHAATDKATPAIDVLKKELASYKLGTEGLDMSVDGGKVILKGHTKNRETLEKAILAVGNIHGIQSVDADAVTFDEPDVGESTFYTVKSGDTLSKIAETQYGKGKGNNYTQIFEANKPMLTSPDKIYPGQVLRIPPLK